MSKVLLTGILFIFLGLFDFGHTKLLAVHSIFRHGERTADTFLMYPNDPYKNESFYPFGNGQMTNKGKKTMYNFGKVLKKKYGNFLGDIYLPGLIDPWASSLPRTQVALQLTLAALFPPKDVLVWDEDLNWQPIPYQYLSREDDDLLLSVISEDYIQVYNKFCETEEAKDGMKRAAPLLSYIRQYSGSPANTPRDFFFLYITFSTEDHFGLSLPQWTKAIYPQPIKDMIHLEFEMEMGTKRLRKFLIGRLLKKILTDTENRINGKSSYKMHMYSAHDVNIVYVLMFLDLMYKHSPGYSACLSLEVHEESGRYFIQVQYKDDKHADFKPLHFPNGKDRISLEEFRNKVEELVDVKEEDESRRDTLGSSVSKGIKKGVTYLEIAIILFCCQYIFRH